MSELKNIIAKNISDLRKDRGLTQLELAERLNYSEKSVSKWERAEAIPDVAVLKEIADLFGVTLDYMVEEEHKQKTMDKISAFKKLHNHAFITGICVLVVWLLALMGFVIADIVSDSGIKFTWLSFVYAVPLTFVVWLVLNSIWFNKRRNYFIISLLMWTSLAAIFVSFLLFENNLWKIFLLGIPAQVIIIFWSRLEYKKVNKGSAENEL